MKKQKRKPDPAKLALAKQVITKLGGVSAAASELGISRQRAHTWQVRGLPPLWEKYLRCSHPEVFAD